MALPPVLQNLPLPIIGAPLFIISNPKLVIAQCTAGVVGSMPALNARPASQLDEWLAEITEGLAAWNRDHPDRPAGVVDEGRPSAALRRGWAAQGGVGGVAPPQRLSMR